MNGQSDLNGSNFKRYGGYVEQFDYHLPYLTARESVDFAAALRLPSNTSEEVRKAVVEETLTTCELLNSDNVLVGKEDFAGLTRAQAKCLSIAVEVAANSSCLFLDEPTTSLDFHAAHIIMRCIQRVAKSGRTVVCSIHQPTAFIFEGFETLLLLGKGGVVVYFGEIGNNSKTLIDHFTGAPNVLPLEYRENPATWMMNVISKTGSSRGSDGNNLDEYFLESFHYANYENKRKELMQKDYEPIVTRDPHTMLRQFQFLLARSRLSYWRCPQYNMYRFLIYFCMSSLFASIITHDTVDEVIHLICKINIVYLTPLFVGIVAMFQITPYAFSERLNFYREKSCCMYNIEIYSIAVIVVEVSAYILFVVCCLLWMMMMVMVMLVGKYISAILFLSLSHLLWFTDSLYSFLNSSCGYSNLRSIGFQRSKWL